MAAALDMGIVLAALGAAAWYTGRRFWRTGAGAGGCGSCPSAAKPGNTLVQLRRPR